MVEGLDEKDIKTQWGRGPWHFLARDFNKIREGS